MTLPPPDDVVAAFGARGHPRPLAGGQGTTWLVGEVVLKPTGDPIETTWRSEVLADLAGTAEFAVAKPVRSSSGDWIVGGWEASHAVAGKEDHGRPDDVLRAGAAFHNAIDGLAKPAFLDTRSSPWDHGDRMAWEEVPLAGGASTLRVLERLAASRRPVDVAAQVVHGDLLGNVLLAADGPPVIIDWPVYHRPAGWAAAVAVCDAITWYGASPELIDRWSHLAEWKQMLVRAAIYRLVIDDVVAGPDGPAATVLDTHGRMADILLRY